MLLNIWGQIATVPTCSSGNLTIVLPHTNAMPQTQDITPHPIVVYRHSADLLLCYPLTWNITLEYTSTHFNVFGQTQLGNPSPHLSHTPVNAQLYDAVMVVVSQKLDRKYTVPIGLEPGTCGMRIHYDIRSLTAASSVMFTDITMYSTDITFLQISQYMFVVQTWLSFVYRYHSA